MNLATSVAGIRFTNLLDYDDRALWIACLGKLRMGEGRERLDTIDFEAEISARIFVHFDSPLALNHLNVFPGV